MSNNKPRMTLEDVKKMTEKAGKYDELVKQNKRYRESINKAVYRLTSEIDSDEMELSEFAKLINIRITLEQALEEKT